MDGMGKAGIDVTQSLPLMRRSLRQGKFSGSTVTHADVTASLRPQLQKAPFDRKALDEFKVTHSLDPELSLSAKFAAVEQQEPDTEASVFYSLKDLPSPDDSLDPSLQEDNTGVDVEQSLTLAAIQSLRSPDPEASLFPSSRGFATDDSLVKTDIHDAGDDEDDAMFQSASNVMFGDRYDQEELLKKQLEQFVAMSLMPTADEIKLTKSEQLEEAWRQLTLALGNDGKEEEVGEFLNNLVSLYPVVSNPEKMAGMLNTQIEQASSAQEAITNCQQLMGKFQLAGEVREADLTTLDQLSEHDALQTLLIIRQKTVSEGAPVAELEKMIQERLMQAHGEKIVALTGLNINEKNPDYDHFKQLKETLGTLSLPEPTKYEKSSYVDKQRYIPIDPAFEHVDVELSGAPVTPRTIEGAIAGRMLGRVTTDPDDSLSELIKLDTWLSDDPTQENAVINLVSYQLVEELKQKGTALGLYDDTRSTPGPVAFEPEKTVVPGAKKRVRFKDQPDVVPRANIQKPRAQRARVDDIVPLSRDSASIEIRAYLDRLNSYMQWLENNAQAAIQAAGGDPDKLTPEGKADVDNIRKFRDYAEQYRKHTAKVKRLQGQYQQQLGQGYKAQSPAMQKLAQQIRTKIADSKKDRMDVLAAIDKDFDAFDQPARPQKEARKQRVSELPFLKAGLIDKEKFLAFHEDQLAQMALRTIDVAFSKATGNETYKLEPSPEPDANGLGHKVDTFGDPAVAPYLVPGRRRRGIPSTSDIMTVVGKAARPYHQAMEINLDDPAIFCNEISGVKDPRVMLALKVRMAKENCPQPMRDNWDKRMKDLMCEYQASQMLIGLDNQITENLHENFEYDAHGPKNPKAHDEYAAKLTVAYGEQMITEIMNGEMNYPGITGSANAGMRKVWADLIKPGEMPTDLDDVLTPYMPTPDQLLHQLESEGLISQAPKQPVVPKQSQVSGVAKAAPAEEQTILGWIVNWFSS